MISSKTAIYLSILLLLFQVNVKAQHDAAEQIDNLLFSAREKLITNPQSCSEISKEIYKLSIENDYAKGQDYGLLLLNFSRLNSRKFDLIIRDIDDLKESAKKHANYEVLAMAFLLEARTLGRIQHYRKGLEEAKKVFDLVKNINSENSRTIYRGLAYQTIGYIQQSHSESRDSVFHYFRNAKDEFQKVRKIKEDGFVMYTKDDLLYTNYAFLANEFMIQKNGFDSVDYYLDRALDLNPKYTDNIATVLIHNNIGWRLSHKAKFDEAIKHYKISVEISKKYNQKETLIHAYDGLANVYHEMKDYKNESIYASLLRLLQEEVEISNKKVVSDSVENFLSKKGTKLESTNKNLSRVIIIITIFVLMCVFAVILLYQKFKNEKLTKVQVENLLKEKMGQIEQESKDLDKSTSTENLQEIVMLAINNDPSFYIKFQETFPEFIERLLEIAPTMVPSELKTAAYIRLDFTTKEIAKYTNMSVRAVEAKKYRLRKKLNIPSESDTNIWFSKV